MLLDEECKGCLYNSQLKKVERQSGADGRFEQFKNGVKLLCTAPPENYCAPLLMRDIDRLHRKIYGCGIDYSNERRLFNGKLLAMEKQIFSKVCACDDPLCEAVKFAMAANYIDFARLPDLDEGAVDTVVKAAERANPDEQTLCLLKSKLKIAKSLCVLHDNCGEIVLDKILIRVILRQYPHIFVNSVVRGSDIINDVTRADAEFINLSEFSRVIDNGTDVPGTYLKQINRDTARLLSESDVIISKGLGNLETLYGEGYSAFYMFTCKCEHISQRFDAEIMSAQLIYEEGNL